MLTQKFTNQSKLITFLRDEDEEGFIYTIITPNPQFTFEPNYPEEEFPLSDVFSKGSQSLFIIPPKKKKRESKINSITKLPSYNSNTLERRRQSDIIGSSGPLEETRLHSTTVINNLTVQTTINKDEIRSSRSTTDINEMKKKMSSSGGNGSSTTRKKDSDTMEDTSVEYTTENSSNDLKIPLNFDSIPLLALAWSQ
eukprot:TRINITY_DN9380_c0_g1_i1.p1 TRINITY_DN9380_c0_g1~~TRINITY_DN9380_c0_g1_i1.p1  ORF type:complete len:197 (-),score=46.02 TRINITY_DN9380_c0_g1_i1:263-853(-)